MPFLFALLFCLVPLAQAWAADGLAFADGARSMVERNRDIQAARRNLEAAEAALLAAGGRPNPTLSLNTTAISPKDGVGPGPLLDKRADTVLRLDQLIERGDKRGLRLAQAEALLQAARADLANTVRQQRAAYGAAYYDLLAAQEQLAIAEDSAHLAQQGLEKARLRYRSGDIAGVDLARIETDALRTDGDRLNAERDLGSARLALATLLAREGSVDDLRVQGPWPALDAGAPAAVDVELRADVVAARHRADAAAVGRQLAEALRKRDVTVGLQLERNYPTSGKLYGVGISIPLFTGYDYEGEIRRAASDADAALEQVERSRAAARAEIARQRRDLELARRRARQLHDEILPLAQKAARGVELAYSHGAASLLDLLDARRALRASEHDLVAAQADHARSLANLQAATETGAEQ
ncbi:MAG TPA: TolC family protein [Rhodocyclaceae bacterium]